MTGDDIPPPLPSLPDGKTDPIELYIAVGMAIHAWEGIEESLACTFAALNGLPERPDALIEYGSENGIFRDRIAAIRRSAATYFVRCPSQRRESDLDTLLSRAENLSIKRHRIAHGHISMWGEFTLPETKGAFEVAGVVLYRWAAPWYSTAKLRSNPVGVNAASIHADRADFEALHNAIATFNEELRPSL